MADSALSDLRIIDLAGEIGVYCTKLLADLGADVIRIEPPDGDPLREIGPFWHDERAADRSLSFFNMNTSKRSVTLDFTQTAGRAVFERLLKSADVVVETYEPGYLDSLGLGYAGLAKIKPDIILTSMLKRIDTAVFEYVKAVGDGQAPSGNVTYDLAGDGVGYSTSGGFVDDIKDQIDAAAEKIKSGEVKVPTAPAN